MKLPKKGLQAVPGSGSESSQQHLRPLPPLPAVSGWKHFPAETWCLLGLSVPFVLILVDISFHTLLNDPLQRMEQKFALEEGKNNVCFRTKQAPDLFS